MFHPLEKSVPYKIGMGTRKNSQVGIPPENDGNPSLPWRYTVLLYLRLYPLYLLLYARTYCCYTRYLLLQKMYTYCCTYVLKRNHGDTENWPRGMIQFHPRKRNRFTHIRSTYYSYCYCSIIRTAAPGTSVLKKIPGDKNIPERGARTRDFGVQSRAL